MNRQELDYRARSYGLAIIIMLCLTALLIPILARTWTGSPITPKPDSYAMLREADLISSGSFGIDPIDGRPFAPNPYALALVVMSVFGVPWLLPLILAVSLLVLLFIFLERHIQSTSIIIASLASIALSPTFSDIGTSHSPVLMALVLILIAALLFEKHAMLSFIGLFFAAITEPVSGIAACLAFTGYVLVKRKTEPSANLKMMLLLACAVAAAIWLYTWTSRGIEVQFLIPGVTSDLLFEFGNRGGLSIFFIVLVVYGMMTKPSFQDARMIIAVIAILIASSFLQALVPTALVMLSVLVGYAIIHLLTARWELELLQRTMVTLVACIGIFLLITSVRERISDSPDSATAHKMVLIKNQFRVGAVLTAPEYAPLVKQISHRRPTVDTKTTFEELSVAFHSRQPTEVYDYLESTDSSYILITQEMRDRTFDRSDEGILFLLDNSERFVKIDDTDGAQLYYFIRR